MTKFVVILAINLATTFCAAKYIFVATPSPLPAAESYCKSTYNGHLAAIHSPADNDAVRAACRNIGQWLGSCLIGLDNSKSLPTRWTDGSNIDFRSWYPGEPDAPGSQPYVQIRPGGDWHTIGPHNLPFVCQDSPASKWSAGALIGGWKLFEGAGKWYECPAGYVIAGFWKNTCQSLYCLEEMYCVAPKVPVASQTCYDMNIAASFDHAGTVECNAGYFVRGIWSNNNQNWNCGLYCWEHLRCCKYDERQLAVSPTSDTQNWWSCFDGSRSGWCLVDNDEYITGFTRTAGNGQLYQLEEAKARKIFKKASVIGLPDQEAPQFEGPPNDITNPNDGGYYIEISKPTFLAIGGLIASVIVVNFIVMCYAKKNKTGNAGYGVVKHIDSDSEYA